MMTIIIGLIISALIAVIYIGAFDAVIGAIKEGVSKDGKAQIIGFGTFSKRTRGARNGRNPQTGQPMKIAAFTTVGFKVGKEFKDDVNKKGKK